MNKRGFQVSHRVKPVINYQACGKYGQAVLYVFYFAHNQKETKPPLQSKEGGICFLIESLTQPNKC